MIIQSTLGHSVSAAWEQKVAHVIDDDDENVEEAPFHIYVQEQMQVKVKLASGDVETIPAYNNQFLLLVTKDADG